VLSDGFTLDGAVVLVDDVVDVVVLVLLGALLPPPPQPTVKTSMAAPPNTANAVLASDLIRLPNLSCERIAPPAYPQLRSGKRVASCSPCAP
jgi:hypothetical protein